MNTKAVHFFKYQGAGNDFIIVDNREGVLSHLDYRQSGCRWIHDVGETCPLSFLYVVFQLRRIAGQYVR